MSINGQSANIKINTFLALDLLAPWLGLDVFVCLCRVMKAIVCHITHRPSELLVHSCLCVYDISIACTQYKAVSVYVLVCIVVLEMNFFFLFCKGCLHDCITIWIRFLLPVCQSKCVLCVHMWKKKVVLLFVYIGCKMVLLSSVTTGFVFYLNDLLYTLMEVHALAYALHWYKRCHWQSGSSISHRDDKDSWYFQCY